MFFAAKKKIFLVALSGVLIIFFDGIFVGEIPGLHWITLPKPGIHRSFFKGKTSPLKRPENLDEWIMIQFTQIFNHNVKNPKIVR